MEQYLFFFCQKIEGCYLTSSKRPWSFVEVGKVPLQMPKLYSLLIHVEDFVRLAGYWASFSEECFEHCQQSYKYLRSRHSHNISAGAQLCSDLHYAWLRSYPNVAALQEEAEKTAFKNNPRLKKRRLE